MRRLTPILLAGLLLIPVPGRTATLSPEELQALAQYSQSLQAVYLHGIEISMEMDEAEALIDAYVDGRLAEPDMRGEVGDIRNRARAAVGEYERSLDALPPRPRTRDRKQDSSMRAFEGMVRDLAESLEAQWRLLERLMKAAVSGDEAAYELASADSLALAGAMLEAENTAIEAAVLGSGPGHPQRGLYDSSIGSNLAMQAALILLEDSLRGREPRMTYARDTIERGLERAENGIETGRRDARAMLTSLGGKPVVTEADRISKRFIGDLVEAYDRAFDDETRIVAAMRDFLEALIAALEAPETQASMQLAAAAEIFQADILTLMDARTREQSVRLQMVEAFSAALAELQ